MRIAVISDIHGNTVALDAVLADAGDVDAYLILGDLCAIGHDPVGVLDRLDALENTHVIRGNTDRYVVEHSLPPPPDDPAANDEMVSGFGWTRDRVHQAARLGWLGLLPVEYRTTLPDGTRVLWVHASPGNDEGRGFSEKRTDDEAEALLEGADADLVLVGHTHVQVDRRYSGVHVINPGPVSNPRQGRDAYYALIEADEDGHSIDLRAVSLDLDALLAALEASAFPGARFVAQHYAREEH